MPLFRKRSAEHPPPIGGERVRAVFPDTNVFMHCRPWHTLAWRDAAGLSATDPLTICVARTVLDEIDNLKRTAPTTRLRRRASDVSKSLQDLFLEVQPQPVSDTELVLVEPREKPEKWNLDASSGDDRLLATVLEAIEAGNCSYAALASDDGGPLVRAKAAGVEVIQIPDEWKYPPEPSSLEKQVQDLRNQLEAKPKPSLRLAFASEQPNDRTFLFQTVRVPEQWPDGDPVAAARQEYKYRYPPGEEPEPEVPATSAVALARSLVSASRSMHAWDNIPDSEYERYNAELDSFFERLEKWRDACELSAFVASRSCKVALTLHNEGTAPVHEVRVAVEAGATGFFLDDEPQQPTKPEPPKPPMGSLGKLAVQQSLRPSLVSPLLSQSYLPGLEPSKFRITNNMHTATFTVKKLRHHDKRTLPSLWLFGAPPESGGSQKVELRCEYIGNETPSVESCELEVVFLPLSATAPELEDGGCHNE